MNFFNKEFEKAILAVMMLDNTLIDIIRGRISKDVFYDSKNKFIYEKICEQWEKQKCVNILTLATSDCGLDASQLAALTNEIPSTANWEFYVSSVLELYVSREMKTKVLETLSTLTGNNTTDVISTLNSQITNFMMIGGSEGVDVKNLCLTIPEKIQKAWKEKKNLLGYSCGYSQLDDITDGFQTKNLYVVGARPSIGKTAFGMNLIANFCRQDIKCSVFSLEMSAEALFYRMLSGESKLPSWQIKKGFCLDYKAGINKLQIGLEKLFSYPLNILDSDISLDNLLYSKIRYEAKIRGSKVILIDHLALINPSNPTGQRYYDVGRITSTLHAMCKELDICIILLCQCGREAEGKRPNLALLRESGNIEQDADVIMFLYRERDMNQAEIPTDVLVEKHRDGKLGTVKMNFFTDQTRFEEDLVAQRKAFDDRYRPEEKKIC